MINRPAFIALMFLLPALLARAGDDDTVVTYDGGSIRRTRITCPERLAHDASACKAYEQDRVDHIVWQYWINAAAPLYGVGLSPADEVQIHEFLEKQRVDNERAAAHYRALWTSVLRIQRGEDAPLVYAAAAAKGVTRAEVDREVAHHWSETWLQTGVERATLQEMGRASRDAKLLVIYGDHLRALIKKRAAEAHIGYSDAEERFWTEVASRTHTRVVDPAFHLPAKRGVLDIHEETIQIHKAQ